jgi:hypothetical protein
MIETSPLKNGALALARIGHHSLRSASNVPHISYEEAAVKSVLNNSLGGLNALYQTGGPRSLQLALKL